MHPLHATLALMGWLPYQRGVHITLIGGGAGTSSAGHALVQAIVVWGACLAPSYSPLEVQDAYAGIVARDWRPIEWDAVPLPVARRAVDLLTTGCDNHPSEGEPGV